MFYWPRRSSPTWLAQNAHELKIAFVDTNTQHAAQNMAFAQTAARNRGIDMRVFATVQEAQAWLRGKRR
jgi:hypothetical protein